MLPYSDLWANKNLNNRISRLENAIKKRYPEDDTLAPNLLVTLRSLQRKLDEFYTLPPGKNTRPVMNQRNIDELQNLYVSAITSVTAIGDILLTPEEKKGNPGRFFQEFKQGLEKDQLIVNQLDARDVLPLPTCVFKLSAEIKKGDYVNGKFKDPGFFEYNAIFLGSGGKRSMSTENALKRFISKSPQQVKEEYERAVDRDPRMFEYRGGYRLPAKIRNSGNKQKLQDFLTEHDAELTYREKKYLSRHIEVIDKKEDVRQAAEQTMQEERELRNPLPLKVDRPTRAELDIHLPRTQTSANGCWSCGVELLLQGRGVRNITQEDIRAYRPELPEDEVVLEGGVMDTNNCVDDFKNVMENGDAFLAFAPNSMLHEVEIAPHSAENERDGYREDRYVANTVDFMKRQIDHAIRVDRSPVVMFCPGHYITIIGIDGDKVKYKDSHREEGDKTAADHTYTANIRDLVENNFFNEKGSMAIQLTWASEVKLAADGTTIHGVPSEFVKMNPDGSLTKQPEYMRALAGEEDLLPIARNGLRVCRPSGDETAYDPPKGFDHYGTDGIQKIDRVYLPKQLNADYLRKMMQKRDPQEEAKLSQYDRDFYGVKGVKPKLSKVANPQANPQGEPKANPQGEPQVKPQGEPQVKPQGEPKTDPPEIQQPKTSEITEPKIVPPQKGEQDKKPQSEPGQKEPDKEPKIVSRKKPARDLDSMDAAKTTRSAFTRILNVERRKQKQEKTLEAADREYAEGRREEYSVLQIRDKAATMYRALSAIDPFYLPNKTGGYKELKQNMEKLRKLGDRAVEGMQKKDASFTVADTRKMVELIDASVKYGRQYLSSKFRALEKDPLRKSDPGKQDYEQPRIRAVLDAYQTLLDMKTVLKAKEGRFTGLRQEAADNEKMIRDFRKALLFDTGKKKEKVPALAQNRTAIPESHMAGLRRLEALYARKPERIDDLEGVQGLETVKEIDMKFRKPGTADKAEEISSKDFIAVAVGASIGRMDRLRMITEGSAKDMSSALPAVTGGRQTALHAFRDYEAGNREPLARLIANRINDIADLGRQPGDTGMKIYMTEMGQRMKGLLEKDRDLMKAALNEGLRPTSLKALRSMEIENRYTLKAEEWKRKGAGIQTDRWSLAMREERYTDLLMERYIVEAEEAATKLRNADPAFRKEMKKAKEPGSLLNAAATAERKYRKPNLTHETLGDPGQEQKLRRQIREYLRETGYGDLTPKQFLEQIYEPKPGAKRKFPVSVELANMETRKQEKPAKKAELTAAKKAADKNAEKDIKKDTKKGTTNTLITVKPEVKKGMKK